METDFLGVAGDWGRFTFEETWPAEGGGRNSAGASPVERERNWMSAPRSALWSQGGGNNWNDGFGGVKTRRLVAVLSYSGGFPPLLYYMRRSAWAAM